MNILIVDDEKRSQICSSSIWRAATFTPLLRLRGRSARRAGQRIHRPGAARRHAAGRRRFFLLPRNSGAPYVSHSHAHRKGRGSRQNIRLGLWRGRLYHKTLQPAGSCRPGESAAAPIPQLWRRAGKGSDAFIGALSISKQSHTCTHNGKALSLTPIEFDILWTLCQNRGSVVSSEELFEQVWGEKYLESNNTVMVHIRRLREKLGSRPETQKLLKPYGAWGIKLMRDRKNRKIDKRLRGDVYRRLFVRLAVYSALYWGLFFLINTLSSTQFYQISEAVWQFMSALVFMQFDPLIAFWIVYFTGFFLIAFFSLRRLLSQMGLLASSIDLLTDEQAPLPPFPDDMREVEARLEKTRQALFLSRRLAAEAEQRKNDLVVYLAHDLKTPLTSVIGYLSLLEEAPDMPPAQRAKYTGIALKKAYRLEDLVNEFFDITRFNLTTLELERGKVNLSLLLGQLADEFYPVFLSATSPARQKLPRAFFCWRMRISSPGFLTTCCATPSPTAIPTQPSACAHTRRARRRMCLCAILARKFRPKTSSAFLKSSSARIPPGAQNRRRGAGIGHRKPNRAFARRQHHRRQQPGLY